DAAICAQETRLRPGERIGAVRGDARGRDRARDLLLGGDAHPARDVAAWLMPEGLRQAARGRRVGSVSALAQRLQVPSEDSARVGAESSVELTFVLGEDVTGALVRYPAILGDGRAYRPPVLGISHALHESVGLQPVDELRDVRLSAAVPFSQLREGQR